jgi:hypothetical protein
MRFSFVIAPSDCGCFKLISVCRFLISWGCRTRPHVNLNLFCRFRSDNWPDPRVLRDSPWWWYPERLGPGRQWVDLGKIKFIAWTTSHGGGNDWKCECLAIFSLKEEIGPCSGFCSNLYRVALRANKPANFIIKCVPPSRQRWIICIVYDSISISKELVHIISLIRVDAHEPNDICFHNTGYSLMLQCLLPLRF